MRLGWEVGGCEGWSGCAVGAGTTAGPGRLAGDTVTAVVPAMLEVTPEVVSGVPAAVPGDWTVGVPTLPALVRAIVLAGCTVAAPLALAY